MPGLSLQRVAFFGYTVVFCASTVPRPLGFALAPPGRTLLGAVDVLSLALPFISAHPFRFQRRALQVVRGSLVRPPISPQIRLYGRFSFPCVSTLVLS